MVRVLLVEDDPAIAAPLTRAVARDGHDVHLAVDGSAALSLASASVFDLVILDLGLPDMDGVDVCRQLRRGGSDVPIIVVTARTDELDAIIGLNAGADDYVTKPFRMGELLARVRASVRRRETEQHSAQDVRIDRAARRAWQGGTELSLTAKEFDLLALLVGQAGTVLTREHIMERIWDEHWFGSTKTLDVHVSWLRRKLGDDSADPRYLTTVRGVGLRFET